MGFPARQGGVPTIVVGVSSCAAARMGREGRFGKGTPNGLDGNWSAALQSAASLGLRGKLGLVWSHTVGDPANQLRCAAAAEAGKHWRKKNEKN